MYRYYRITISDYCGCITSAIHLFNLEIVGLFSLVGIVFNCLLSGYSACADPRDSRIVIAGLSVAARRSWVWLVMPCSGSSFTGYVNSLYILLLCVPIHSISFVDILEL